MGPWMRLINNQGGGQQDFSEAEFTTGGRVTGGYSTYNYHNNGTRNAFNNSNGGTQNFSKAKFNTGARIDWMLNSLLLINYLINY